MSELRAPDPTLTACERIVVVHLSEDPVPAAHLLDDADPYEGLRCGTPDAGDEPAMRSHHAAYIAVPCRDCFPDAPPPGKRWFGNPNGTPIDGGDGLAWQVPA